ncbi:prepilin-type N-terminal cleavage/methylation domain-containing protein [Candidatus Saccharibacteria bacterium]|nr:prepilin-type N-terminal cleavage/methylation domain-containing protein [Candidatus Saccharibacteria bacterium]
MERTIARTHGGSRLHSTGFTIVELLIVIVIIGILAVLAIGAYSRSQDQARSATAQSDLKSSAKQLEQTKADTGTYPSVMPSLPTSPNTSYQYAYNAATDTYCLTANNGTPTFKVTSQNRSPVSGPCPGHGTGGTASTTISDDFARTVSSGWGTASGGGTWSTANGSVADYSVSSTTGRIAMPTANNSRYTRLSQTFATYDVRTRLTLSTMPAGAANSAALVGSLTDSNNHYRFRLTFGTTGAVTAAITINEAGTETNLGSNITVGSSFAPGQRWWIRGTYDGTTLSMYAWQDGTAEPSSPTLSLTNTVFQSGGRVGIRAFSSTGATNAPELQVDSFSGIGG